MAASQGGGGFRRFLRNVALVALLGVFAAGYAWQKGWWEPDTTWLTTRGAPSPQASPTPAPSPSVDPSLLRIGVDDRAAYLPFWAVPSMIEDPTKLRVQLVVVPDAELRWQMLAANRLDLAVGTLDSFTTAASRIDPGAMIFEIGSSAGADQLLVTPDLTSIKALIGKRIAVVRGTAGRYLMATALDRERIAPSLVQLVEVDDVRDAVALLQSGKVSGAWVWSPHGSALATGGYRKLVDTRALEPVREVAVASRQALQEKKAALEGLIAAWFAIVDKLHVTFGIATDIIARGAGIKPSLVSQLLDEIKLTSAHVNQSMDADAVLGSLRDTRVTLRDIGTVNMVRQPDETSVDLSILRNMTIPESTPAPSSTENADRP